MKGYPYSVYSKISYDDLLVYALSEAQNGSRSVTFENLVAKAFELFPKRFQLPGYPNWPDSSLVEKSWVRCRTDKGLIYGSKSKGFTLTSKGAFTARGVLARLKQKPLESSGVHIKGDRKTRSGRVVKHIEESPAFQKYSNSKKLEGISEFEFCDLLYSTLDTKPDYRKRNLEELKYHAKVYERSDLVSFLEKLEEQFQNLLRDPSGKHFAGGMMKRKNPK